MLPELLTQSAKLAMPTGVWRQGLKQWTVSTPDDARLEQSVPTLQRDKNAGQRTPPFIRHRCRRMISARSIWIYKKQSPTLYCKHSEIESKHRPLTMKITMTATCTRARAKVGFVVLAQPQSLAALSQSVCQHQDPGVWCSMILTWKRKQIKQYWKFEKEAERFTTEKGTEQNERMLFFDVFCGSVMESKDYSKSWRPKSQNRELHPAWQDQTCTDVSPRFWRRS